MIVSYSEWAACASPFEEVLVVVMVAAPAAVAPAAAVAGTVLLLLLLLLLLILEEDTSPFKGSPSPSPSHLRFLLLLLRPGDRAPPVSAVCENSGFWNPLPCLFKNMTLTESPRTPARAATPSDNWSTTAPSTRVICLVAGSG